MADAASGVRAVKARSRTSFFSVNVSLLCTIIAQLEHPSLLATGNEPDQANFGKSLICLRNVAASQDPAAALDGNKDTRSENFTPPSFFSNDQAHRKIRNVRQDRTGHIVCHVENTDPHAVRDRQI